MDPATGRIDLTLSAHNKMFLYCRIQRIPESGPRLIKNPLEVSSKNPKNFSSVFLHSSYKLLMNRGHGGNVDTKPLLGTGSRHDLLLPALVRAFIGPWWSRGTQDLYSIFLSILKLAQNPALQFLVTALSQKRLNRYLKYFSRERKRREKEKPLPILLKFK